MKSLLAMACPPAMLFWGTSDYLILRGSETLIKKWLKESGSDSRSHEADGFDGPSLAMLCQERDLFSGAHLNLMRRLEQAPRFAKALEALPAKSSITNPLCLTFTGKTLSKPLDKELARLGVVRVPCFDPLASEMPIFIEQLCRKKQLTLSPEAVQTLIAMHGTDLSRIENELCKLEYMAAKGSVSKEMILSLGDASHVEHIFALEQHILQNRTAQCHLLALSLVQKGEAPLALTGYLSNVVRKALKIQSQDQQGKAARQIAQDTRLPPKVVEDYLKYVRRLSRGKLLKALEVCQQVDVTLKSRRTAPELLVGDLVASCLGQI